MNRAFIFPGQGSQIVGMGKDFYDNFKAAKDTFELIDDTLNCKLSNIIFNGPDHELTITKNTQPALMAVSMAIINTLKDQIGYSDIVNLCGYVAGHSLGEYSALCASNSISLADTSKLLQIRGTAMQDASEARAGVMAACIGIDIASLEEILFNFDREGECCIANDNAEGQIVISGCIDKIEQAIAILKDSNVRAIKLKVSGAFHSKLMTPAQEVMRNALSNIVVNTPVVPVITNVGAIATTDKVQIKEDLITQVSGRVRWRETIDQLINYGVHEVIEIGSGCVLTGMLKRSKPALRSTSISTVQQFDEFMKSI